MTPKRRVVLLANPTAARATPQALWVATNVLRHHCDVTYHRPASPGAMAEHALEAARTGSTVVVAGGDGTVNLVVNAIAGHDVPLGILPLGTANDLAVHLGIAREPTAAAEQIAAGSPRRIDLIEANGRRFCTVGGLGLVSQSADSVNRVRARSRWRRAALRPLGSEIYALAALANILGRRQIVGRVRIDDDDPAKPPGALADEPVHGIFVANQATLGGGLRLPGDARNSDGQCEIILVRATSRWRLIAALQALRSGRPLPAGVVSQVPARQVRITCDRDDAFLGDGEILCRGRAFQVRVLPGAQPFIC